MRPLALALLLAFASACGDPPALSAEQQALFDQPVDAELVVVPARNAMRYETTTLEAPAGATVRLVLDNTETTSPAMVHNAVVLRSVVDVDRVGRAASGAPDNIPDDAAIVAYTPLTQPRLRSAVVFTMPRPGSYPFICTFPGHFQSMQGTLVSTPPAAPAGASAPAPGARTGG